MSGTGPGGSGRRCAEIYCTRSGDPSARERIAVYEPLMLVWWSLRLGRFLRDAQAGRDRRLVKFSQPWLEERQKLQGRYQRLAQTALANWQSAS